MPGRQKSAAILPLLDLLGRRWTLRILWELSHSNGSAALRGGATYKTAPALRGGATYTFRALQDACGGVSPTVLNERLHELREIGVIVPQSGGYALSPAGRALAKSLTGIHGWADRHLRGNARR